MNDAYAGGFVARTGDALSSSRSDVRLPAAARMPRWLLANSESILTWSRIRYSP